MNKAFICRQFVSEAWTASMALLTFHCSQSKIHMARACACLITWLLVRKVLHTPNAGLGRLVVNRFLLLQFSEKPALGGAISLYYFAFWKPTIILETQ